MRSKKWPGRREFRGKISPNYTDKSQDDQAVAELKGEIHSLVDELNALSLRNDEIMAEREQDAATVNDMEARVEEYRRKYDSVRIELRNLKGRSFVRRKPAIADTP